ncbi:MAG: glycosyltransferase family 39 protein [Thermoanaerobaculia bacterium]
MPRRLRLALWAVILLLALGLRLPALTAALPYIGYVDEGWVLHPVVRMVEASTWDPGWYTYPSLPLYAVAGAVEIYRPVYRWVHGGPLRDDLVGDPPWHGGRIEPVEVIVAGRLTVLAASLGTALLTGLLARRLAGNAAGLLAALLAALVPALVIRGAIASVDPWAAFFVVAALYFAEKADAGLAGVMIGCALTSKYPAALVALAVVPVLLRMEGGWRRRLRAVGLAAGAGLLAAVATMPALALRAPQVYAALSRQAEGYAQATIGGFWDQAVRRAEWDQPLDAPELGLPLVICAALGWLAAAVDRRTRATALSWGLYAGVLALVLSSYPCRPFRNWLPLVPLACVCAAFLFVRLGERLRRPAWSGVAAAALAASLLLPSFTFARTRAGQTDSRADAVDWLARQVRPGEAVLVSEELGAPRGELDRLPLETEVLNRKRARARLQRYPYRYIVTGRFGAGPSLADYLERGRTPYALAASFGETGASRPPAGAWRGNRRRVLVFRRSR